MVRLEMKAGGHNKFWTINQNDSETTVTYGAIGAKPRKQHKEHGSAEKAVKFMDQQMKKKKKEGYVETIENAEGPATKKSKTDGGEKTTTRLENRGDGHNKFWQITINGTSTLVEYGAIDATPRTNEKDHGSVKDAEKFMLKMVGKKKKDGYSVVNGAPAANGGMKEPCEPHLFVFGEPCSALELEKRRDDWEGPDGEDDLCSRDHMHGKMNDAPAAAKAIAELLHAAMPELDDTQMVMSSEGSDGGEVIVIACPGDDARIACLKGLAVKKQNFEKASEAASLKQRNWADHVRLGFNRDPDDDFNPDEEFDEDMADERKQFDAVLQGTRILSDKLTKHFEFNFSDQFAVAPVVFGGYASDGSIVGILSSRVWT